MMEKWREFYTEEQIRKIQELELRNLKVLCRVCKELDIQFFLYGGSLIGAVRHKGFVPWDDDLDIAMMRDDYMKFVQEAPALLPDEYYLQTPYNDKNTPYLYTKLRLKGTRCIDYIHHRLKMEQGIYVDIYPIDNIPDSDEEFLKCYYAYQAIVRKYVFRQSPYPAVEGKSLVRKMKNLARFVLSSYYKLYPQGYFVQRADKLMTKFNHVQTVRKGNFSFPDPKNLFYDMLPLEDGIFEGIPVKLPKNWDLHLQSRYGDYMQLPPEEEQVGHVPYILDFGEY